MRITFRRVLFLLLLGLIGYGIYYAWYAFPIISGFTTKNICSCIFVSGQHEDSARKDYSGFPFSMASISINYRDSSVTGTVLGMAEKKAVYRKGLGCTLVNGLPETGIRNQRFSIIKPPLLSDTTPWPIGNAVKDTMLPEVNRKKLGEAVESIFTGKEAHSRTRAVVVVYKGELIVEKYAPGFSKDSRMIGWSMAKSFTSAIMGILVKQGKLNITDPAPVAEWNDPKDRRHGITTEFLLQQRSGLDFTENYRKYSDVTNMLFNEPDMGRYTRRLPLRENPGSRFYYSSGNSNILSGIIRQMIDPSDYPSFWYRELFYKIGMASALMEPDASGTLVGSSYVYATARDYARFGLLYAHDGMWKGERILPEGWVQKTTTAPSINSTGNYGYQFWLNGRYPNDTSKRLYPQAPRDLYYADGFGGQNIYVIPSRHLVIVRLGMDNINEDAFLNSVMNSISE